MNPVVAEEADIRGLVCSCNRIFKYHLGFRAEKRAKILGYSGNDIPEEDRLIRALAQNKDQLVARYRLIIRLNELLTDRFGEEFNQQKRTWLDKQRIEFKASAGQLVETGDISRLKLVICLAENLDS